MKLSVDLLKEEVLEFEEAIKTDKVYDQYDWGDTFEFDGTIIIGALEQKVPDWVEFLNKERKIDMNLEDYYNQSTRGILMVRVETRILAFTF